MAFVLVRFRSDGLFHSIFVE